MERRFHDYLFSPSAHVALKIEIRVTGFDREEFDFCIDRFSERIDFHRDRPISYVLNNAGGF